jgi:hypothetical protein
MYSSVLLTYLVIQRSRVSSFVQPAKAQDSGSAIVADIIAAARRTRMGQSAIEFGHGDHFARHEKAQQGQKEHILIVCGHARRVA